MTGREFLSQLKNRDALDLPIVIYRLWDDGEGDENFSSNPLTAKDFYVYDNQLWIKGS